MPEPPVLAARNEHAHFGSPVTEIVGDDLEDRPIDPPVRAVHGLERDPRQTDPLPFLAERRRLHGVDRNVDGSQLVGQQRPRILQCASRGPVELVNEYQHRVATQDRRLERRRRLVRQFGLLGLVLAVEPHQQCHHDRHQQHDEPRTTARTW